MGTTQRKHPYIDHLVKIHSIPQYHPISPQHKRVRETRYHHDKNKTH